jgi:hypothetical protein
VQDETIAVYEPVFGKRMLPLRTVAIDFAERPTLSGRVSWAHIRAVDEGEPIHPVRNACVVILAGFKPSIAVKLAERDVLQDTSTDVLGVLA